MVCDRTEGWLAGSQLAGLSVVSESNRSAFIESFAGDDRNVADYLASEVLHRQPEQRRQFLLKTSVLDEINAEVCDFLLEADDSAAMLEEIERSNLFLVGLDSHRTWYRYHHLFRDWLRHEHQLAPESETIALLHRRHPPPVELPRPYCLRYLRTGHDSSWAKQTAGCGRAS